MKKRLALIIVAQLILLVIEWGTHYDMTQRQIALSITNILGTIGILWLDGWLGRRGRHLSAATMILALGSIWLDALGNFQHLYGHFWWWDRITHLTGGMAVSAVFIDLFLASRQTAMRVSERIWFGFLLGQFVAAMYEVSEWLGDMWFHTARVRGPFDTPHDLFFNMAGGLLVVALFWLTREKK